VLAVDLLNPTPQAEARKHKLKMLVPGPRSFFMDVKCPGCFTITTVFSHAQTVVVCAGCSQVLCQPTGGKARLTEGCSFRRNTASMTTTRYTESEWRAMISEVARELEVYEQDYCPDIDKIDIARTIDHTLLKLDATPKQIDELCAEARVANFASVCVRPNYVAQAHANLKGSNVLIASVIGFHQGTQDTYYKLQETRKALTAGAHELDVVINWPLLKQQEYSEIYHELALIRSMAPQPTVLKLIFETSQLASRDIVAACTIASAANFDFVKTSTGFLGHGAKVEHVRLMRAACDHLADKRTDRHRMQVKASGGVRTVEDAITMLKAGATRLGTSGGMWIVKESKEQGVRKSSPVQSERRGSRPTLSTRLFTDY
ncbi:deoxyribose-phosphate aldolase, partial [Aureobasidium melanogenum]